MSEMGQPRRFGAQPTTSGLPKLPTSQCIAPSETMGHKRKVVVPPLLITARRSGGGNCNRFLDDLRLSTFASKYG